MSDDKKWWTVKVPIAGFAYVSAEAETEEGAKQEALEAFDYEYEEGEEPWTVEWDTYGTEGVEPGPEATVEVEIDDRDDEEEEEEEDDDPEEGVGEEEESEEEESEEESGVVEKPDTSADEEL